MTGIITSILPARSISRNSLLFSSERQQQRIQIDRSQAFSGHSNDVTSLASSFSFYFSSNPKPASSSSSAPRIRKPDLTRPSHLSRPIPLNLQPPPPPCLQIHSRRSYHRSSSSPKMSSDEAYASFLDKANQDTSSSSGAKASSSSAKSKLKTLDKNAQVPAPLQKVDATYTSESDEPFEPVVLEFEKGGSLDGDTLAKLVGHSSSAEELSTKDFDPRGEYKAVIEAVETAVKGGVKVFRVETGRSRAEYFVVGVDGEGRVVGVKASAVES